MAELIYMMLTTIVGLVTVIGIIAFIYGITHDDIEAHSQAQIGFFMTLFGGPVLWALISLGIEHEIYTDPVDTEAVVEEELK